MLVFIASYSLFEAVSTFSKRKDRGLLMAISDRRLYSVVVGSSIVFCIIEAEKPSGVKEVRRFLPKVEPKFSLLILG